MANLITGPLLADGMYVTVQKEVADRMVASPGSSDYGTISILMSATGNVHMLRKLPPAVFWPRPQVHSAMVVYNRDPEKADKIHSMEIFTAVINMFMGHRRKMLKACTKFAPAPLDKIHNWQQIFDEAFVDPHKRPEDLSAVGYVSIANLCAELLH